MNAYLNKTNFHPSKNLKRKRKYQPAGHRKTNSNHKKPPPPSLKWRPNTFLLRLFTSQPYTLLLSIQFITQIMGTIITHQLIMARSVIQPIWPKLFQLATPKKPPDIVTHLYQNVKNLNPITMILACLWSSFLLPPSEFLLCDVSMLNICFTTSRDFFTNIRNNLTITTFSLLLQPVFIFSFSTTLPLILKIFPPDSPTSALSESPLLPFKEYHYKTSNPNIDIDFTKLFALEDDEINNIISPNCVVNASTAECSCPVCTTQHSPTLSPIGKNYFTFNATHKSMFPTSNDTSSTSNKTPTALFQPPQITTCLPCGQSEEKTTGRPPKTANPKALTMCYKLLSSIGEAHQHLTAIVDTGATRAVIANENEFTSLTKKKYDYKLQGIAKGLEIKGEGTVEYDVLDKHNNKAFTLSLRAYWTPDLADARLIPPQNLRTPDGLRGGVDTPGNENEDGSIDRSTFATLYTFDPSTPSTRITSVALHYNISNNLPIVRLRLPQPNQHAAKALTASIHLTSQHNHNLSQHQKELLAWHFKLGHVGF